MTNASFCFIRNPAHQAKVLFAAIIPEHEAIRESVSMGRRFESWTTLKFSSLLPNCLISFDAISASSENTANSVFGSSLSNRLIAVE